MAEDLEKEDKKETKKARTGTKTSKTSTTKKATTKKAQIKKEEEKVENVAEKKKRGRPAKKKEEAETNKSSRLEDLTELMEKIEKETQKTKRKTKKEVDQDTKENEKDIVEEIENIENEVKEETKDLTVKKNTKEIMINPEKLEKIEEEIKKQTTISEEKKNKINKIIFHNIAIANIVMLYFIFLILGYQTISPEKFMIDLQVFSGITIGLAIIVFEKAYKKDSGEYAIHGIETLFLAIVTLISIYIYSKYQEKFTIIMLIICYLFDIYYVAKSIMIYLKMRTKALKRVNDIHKIAKS